MPVNAAHPVRLDTVTLRVDQTSNDLRERAQTVGAVTVALTTGVCIARTLVTVIAPRSLC